MKVLHVKRWVWSASATPCRGLLMLLCSLPLLAIAPAAWAGDLPRAKPEEVGVSSERLGRIHETIQRHIDEHRISGAVTLVRGGARSCISKHMG